MDDFSSLVLPALGAWSLLFATLWISGILLSRATLGAAMAPPSPQGGTAIGLSATLRRLYRAVNVASAAFFYASLPLVALLVVGLGGAIVWGFIAIGHIPLKLVLLVIVVTCVTMFALFKGIWAAFASGDDEDPGKFLVIEQHPKLAMTLHEVASEIGTRAVQRVFLVPGAELAVFERGGLIQKLRGGGERCLILGAALLDVLTVRQLKSVLAHEYGHFQNADTAGGTLTLAVRRSLMHTIVALAKGNAAAWYNPAWWFVRGYYKVYLRISQGASRLQEVLADRWAITAYGSSTFEEAFVAVLRASARFDARAKVLVCAAIEHQVPIHNFFRQDVELSSASLEADVKEALGMPAGEFDSHPSPEQRVAWARMLKQVGRAGESLSLRSCGVNEHDLSWLLLEGRTALELEMTDVICSNVAVNVGVHIPRETETARAS